MATNLTPFGLNSDGTVYPTTDTDPRFIGYGHVQDNTVHVSLREVEAPEGFYDAASRNTFIMPLADTDPVNPPPRRTPLAETRPARQMSGQRLLGVDVIEWNDNAFVRGQWIENGVTGNVKLNLGHEWVHVSREDVHPCKLLPGPEGAYKRFVLRSGTIFDTKDRTYHQPQAVPEANQQKNLVHPFFRCGTFIDAPDDGEEGGPLYRQMRGRTQRRPQPTEAEVQAYVDKLLSPEPSWKAWGGETEGEALAHFFDRSQHECAPDPAPDPAPERPDIPYLVARLVDGLETELTIDEYTRLPANVRSRTRQVDGALDGATGTLIHVFSPDNEEMSSRLAHDGYVPWVAQDATPEATAMEKGLRAWKREMLRRGLVAL